MSDLASDDKLIRILSQKGLDYYKEVHSLSLSIINGRKPLELQNELINKGMSRPASKRMIVNARKLLAKNLTRIQEDIATVHTERYNELYFKFMEMEDYDSALLANEQEEVLNGMHSKSKTTVINNIIEENYIFDPKALNPAQKDELNLLVKKAFLLSKHV